MNNNNTRQKIQSYAEMNDVNITMIDGFDDSIVGLTEDDKLVYSLDKMVEEFSRDNGCSEEDAMEFIAYNTIRSLPYLGDDAPIIIMRTLDDLPS